jgi:hypothetical protein
MNRGLFAAQLNEIEILLGRLALLTERNYGARYQDYGASDFKRLTYAEVWRKCYAERLFDYRLSDDALMQFRAINFRPLAVSYAFYEAPYEPMMYFEDFRDQERASRQADPDELSLARDYELLEPELKERVTPIRYDFSPSEYTEGVHPASHVHFGHRSEVRIGTRRILRPISFVLLILRQYYPAHWRLFLALPEASTMCRNVLGGLERVARQYWRPLDRNEMTLE